MISGLLQGLEATANKASIQEDQANDAIAAIRNLDRVVKGILKKVGTVEIDWPVARHQACPGLATRYPGLRFTGRSDLPSRSNARTPDYCQNCGWHRDEHLPDAAHEPPHRPLATEAKGLGGGTCRFDPWPEKAEKS